MTLYDLPLAALVIVLIVVGHLRRTGIGRRIIGAPIHLNSSVLAPASAV